MQEKNFTHLHVHTQYSLLDGASKITDLVARAKEFGMDSIAITDHGVMYGVIDFYKECKKEGIKPILGVEAYVINGDILDKDGGLNEERYHLILLAENEIGYKNLMKLVSISHKDGYYYKPRMNKEMLRKYHEGIIALSACLSGEVARVILSGDIDMAKKVALDYKDIFGENNFYLEMQANTVPNQTKVNEILKKMSAELNIPLVATCDSHYLTRDDYKTQEILMCIQTGKKITDEDRMRLEQNAFYFKNYDEMTMIFDDEIGYEALENTNKIAARCNVEIEFGKYKLPRYEMNDDDIKKYGKLESKELLEKLCLIGLDKYFKTNDNEYIYDINDLKNRLKYELDTINQMGFTDYFLIVWDFIKFAKDNDIPVGPGRGSAAGSLVSYLLNITEVDPIKYNLLFERFLNPERVSMPDIDVDFCNIRRGEVIEYVTKKYGAECVSQIVTFGTMAARQVIRDVGRVLDVPYSDVDIIAKMIPYEMHVTIDKALEENSELKTLYLQDEKVREIIDTAKKLEGLPRHASTHAAGVVICDKPIYEYVPLSKSEDFVVTEFNMTTIEELGLLKMDFLGLRNLSVINNTIKSIKENKNIDLDIRKIDMNDKNVYDMISKGDTSGVFQLESKGMTQFMKELKPERLEDIIAGISLYRPGPMDFIPNYIKGKNNPSSIKYDHELLIPILKDTNGVIVYQEQVMQILKTLAGYSLGDSDLIRRAMSKKKMDVMIKEKETFVYGDETRGIKGAINNGIDKLAAELIFDKMIDFANYAFNKSHSACYSFVAYQTAYLKYYYKSEFFASLISSGMANQGMTAYYIEEARRSGIEVKAPDVNESGYLFNANKDGSISYALSQIKGIGMDIIINLQNEREENGLFKSLTDFIERMLKYNISKKAIENLIKVGAFDNMGGHRSQYLAVYMLVYDRLLAKAKRELDGQLDLFSIGLSDEEKEKENYDDFPELDELDDKIKLLMEKELLGLYVSGHPLKEYEKAISKYNAISISDILMKNEETDEYEIKDNKEVLAIGIINNVNLKVTKNNSMMCFIKLEDMSGEIEVIVFPKTFDRYKHLLREEDVIMLRARCQVKEDNVQLIAEEIKSLDNEVVMSALTLKVDTVSDKNMLDNIKKIMQRYEGNSTCEIYSKDDGKTRYPKLKIRVCEELLKELGFLLGDSNVISNI